MSPEPKVLQFDLFQGYPELVHGISTADFGNLSYKWAEANSQTPDDVRKSRQHFFGILSVPEDQVIATQVVDGPTIHNLTADDRGKGIIVPEEGIIGDGFFTKDKDTFLFLITGDCLALFLYDPIQQVCGLIHAGYKGADQELPRLAVEHAISRYGCDPSNIRIGLSPALRQKSTTLEHLERFDQNRLQRWQPYLSRSGSNYLVDWVGFAINQLTAAGIKPENIEDCGVDTRTSTEYFSHARSQAEKTPEARYGCVIGIRQ